MRTAALLFLTGEFNQESMDFIRLKFMSDLPAVRRLFQRTLHQITHLPGTYCIIASQRYRAAGAHIFVQPDDKAIPLLRHLDCVNGDARGICSD
ncbi:hypothetical protein D3C81_2053410 [compost metagenome]